MLHDNAIEEQLALVALILDRTKPSEANGSDFANWSNRIGLIASEAGVDVGYIHWGQAPFYVAYELVKFAHNCGIVEALIRVVQGGL